MGKRELVLIVAFIFAGTLLYHATAPPSPGGGFSLRGTLDKIRREMGPRHEYLADERSQTIPISAQVVEVRVTGVLDLRVEGSDDPAARYSLEVYSTGADEAEAKALGKRTTLRAEPSGDLLVLTMTYPPEGRQRTTMTLTVPKRLRVRVGRSTRLTARNVAGVEFDNTRGEATITAIPGVVRGVFNEGELTLEDVGQVDLITRRTELRVTGARGSVRLDLSGGALNARNIGGDLNLHGNRVAIELEDIRGTLTADLAQGSFEATRLARQARVDARGTELRFDLDAPVPVTAITTDENISVNLPATGGFTIEAAADDGQIRMPEGAPAPSEGPTPRVRGPLRGGGAVLALRTTHADIIVR